MATFRDYNTKIKPPTHVIHLISTHPVVGFKVLDDRGTESSTTSVDDNFSGRHDSGDSEMRRATRNRSCRSELHLHTVVCRGSLPDTSSSIIWFLAFSLGGFRSFWCLINIGGIRLCWVLFQERLSYRFCGGDKVVNAKVGIKRIGRVELSCHGVGFLFWKNIRKLEIFHHDEVNVLVKLGKK